MAENPSDLVGREFIFEYGVDRILPPSDKTGGVFATEQRAFRREEIVRCRDCGMCGPDGFCDLLQRHVCPDGFCAWGQAVEGGERR